VLRTASPASTVAALLAATALSLTACSGTDEPDRADTTPAAATPSATPSDAPTAESTDDAPSPEPSSEPPAAPGSPADLTDLVIEPGAVGEARIGMTRPQWEETGYFEDGAAVCEGELIRWAGAPEGFQVLTDDAATITQLHVSVPGPRTAHGDIEVGSTYADLKAAFPDVTEPVADGFDQSSVYPPGEEDGLPYLGFLLADPPAQVTDDTEVVSIAATGGDEAYFQYDC
jgi:hypothetical protein